MPNHAISRTMGNFLYFISKFYQSKEISENAFRKKIRIFYNTFMILLQYDEILLYCRRFFIMENFVSKFGAAFDARKFTEEEFINNPNLQDHFDGLYYRISHGYEDLGRERIMQYVNAKEFYQELFSACAEGDLCETVIYSNDMTNATKEFVDFVENSEYLSMDARRMFIDGFKSSVEAEYLRAFEEEKEMLENLNLKNFPKDGTVELATQKLVSAIADGKLNEKEIDFLSQTFRFYYPLNKYEQKDDYGKPIYGFEPTKLSLANFSREEMEQGIKAGLEKNTDFLRDMQNSGQIVPVPQTYYTNDIDMEKIGEETFQDIVLNGYEPSTVGVALGDAQLFYHNLLGNELYNSEKSKDLHEADDDFDLATKEFLKLIEKEKPEVKSQLLENFKEKICQDFNNDDFLRDNYLDSNWDNAEELLYDDGLLKEKEAYLYLASNLGWQGRSGAKLKNVEKFNDIIAAITPKADYTIDLTHKPNTPYYEAMVYSHDVPTGSHVYILPESQWDKAEEYSFLQDAIKNNSEVKEIFHTRKMKREMEKEAENNPIVKKMLEIYNDEIYDEVGDDTAELYNNGHVSSGAWYNVSKFLADKVVQGTKVSPKDFKKCKALLIKFNPTLKYTSEEISQNFKKFCQKQIEYNEKYANNNQR